MSSIYKVRCFFSPVSYQIFLSPLSVLYLFLAQQVFDNEFIYRYIVDGFKLVQDTQKIKNLSKKYPKK
jgi:hypothetical protein